MRSRHTFAMLQELNIPELIAESAEDYVRIAVQLGVNQEFREQQRQRLLQIGPDLFGNSAGTRALELWIQQTLEIDPV
jgi:predicted O-linked N-acetylglucosamine transferase (SPINDLY family)